MESKIWKSEDVIKVITKTRGVDGRSKSRIIRNLSAQCHDASPALYEQQAEEYNLWATEM